jgi:hypothetical protein
METGGRPDCGVCAAVDVHYLRTGGARPAAVLAADAQARAGRVPRAHAGPVARLASAAASAACRTDLPAGPARSGAARPGPAADGTA